jgi:hypothetical protein
VGHGGSSTLASRRRRGSGVHRLPRGRTLATERGRWIALTAGASIATDIARLPAMDATARDDLLTL